MVHKKIQYYVMFMCVCIFVYKLHKYNVQALDLNVYFMRLYYSLFKKKENKIALLNLATLYTVVRHT